MSSISAQESALQTVGIIVLALAVTLPATARAPAWKIGSCTISKASDDGALWSVQRHGRGALLTVTKLRWSLPKGEAFDVYLYFGGGGFGHYRPATAHRVRGESRLTFDLDDELLLAFKVFNGVLITDKKDQRLTQGLDLEGSSKAYSRLVQC